jgi:uncharacterized protein (DUF58 family)
MPIPPLSPTPLSPWKPASTDSALPSSTLRHFDPRLLATLASLDLQARYVVEGFISGLHRSPFHGFSAEFSEYREYEPGDDPRHVDWRAYARSGRLYVKRYMQETNLACYALVDTSASMEYRGSDAWGSKLEVSRVLGAALSWMMLKQNDAVGLLAWSVEMDGPEMVPPSQKSSQFGMLLRQLDRLTPNPRATLSGLLSIAARRLRRRSLAILISDLLEPPEDLVESLRQLRHAGTELLVLQVLDRDELEFPFAEDTIFEDPETGRRRRVAPAAARDVYLQRFTAFLDSHRDQLRGLEAHHRIVRTDEAPWQAIQAYLEARESLG